MTESPWFSQIVVFEADFDEIELQKYSYDVISVASLPLRHQNNVTKMYQFGLLPIQISG